MVIGGVKQMKLAKEKISFKGYFRIGFDKYSDNYFMETDDTFGNNQYFNAFNIFDKSFHFLVDFFLLCVILLLVD